MWDPERTYVDAETTLEAEVSLLPGVVLRGTCTIGAGAEIGAHSILTDTAVGKGAVLSTCVCTRATIGDGARVGSFSVLEPGAELVAGAELPPHSLLRGPGD
jgi:bifunctional UDP-N-acetylglucosamine pyrophosphorylase/glucosamine-1-phosphate N-acetyltransferase